MDNGRNSCSNNIEYYESLNSTNLINFSNNITSNNGFSQWIEENTCVFCVIIVLLSFALFILITLIMVRLIHGTKKNKIKNEITRIPFTEDPLTGLNYSNYLDLLI